MFRGYLKFVDECPSCGLALGEIRADDFPPYATILIVGHIIVPSALVVEKMYHPSIPVQLSIWMPLTLILSLWFLPRLKGAIVGLMLNIGLKGGETQ